MQVPVPPAPNAHRYVDPETLFALSVPPGWLVDNSGQQGAKLLLLCPQMEGTFRPTLNVMIQDLGILTKDEFLTLTRLQLKLLTGQPRPQRDELYAGLPGAQILEWSATVNDLPLTMCQLLVVAARKAYVLTGTVPTERLPQYRMAFHSVFASFTLPPVVPSASAMVPRETA